MEFVESQGRGNRLSRLTVTLIPERASWVFVSGPVANQLSSVKSFPVVLELRVLDPAGYPTKQVHHVAWYGGTLPPGVGGGTRGGGGPRAGFGAGLGAGGAPGGEPLGVPSELARGLGLSEGTAVQASVLSDVPLATEVEVEPQGPSDWEVVEANAGFLEEHLLGQVGVLSRGQALTVWARGGAAVRFRVLNTQPSALVRLGPGCELHIAPKPRALMPFGGVGQAQDGGRRGQQQQSPGGNRSREQHQQHQQNGVAVPLSGGPGPRGPWPQQQPWQQQQEVAHGGGAVGKAADQGHGGAGGAAGVPVGGLQPRPAWAAALPRPGPGPWSRYDSSGRVPYGNGASGGRDGADGVEGASGGDGWRGALAPAVTAGAVAGSAINAGMGDADVAGSGGVLDERQRAVLAGQVHGDGGGQGYGSGNGSGRGTGLEGGQQGDGGTSGPTEGTPGEPRTAVAAAARAVPGETPEQGQQGEQQQRHLAVPVAQPQVLRLRVLDPPASKYLVPLPTANAALQEGTPGSGREAVGGPGEGTEGAATATPAVHTWLTVTAAVAPSTVAALLALPYEHAVAGNTSAGTDESGLDSSSSGYSGCVDGARMLVRLHGRSAVRDLLAVLVPEPCCPPGHVMLAPPLQHVLGVLPHMAVTVAPAVGGAATGTAAAAAAAEAAPLPSLALHPLPVPAIVGRTPQGVGQVQSEPCALAGGSSGSDRSDGMQRLPAGMAEAAATAAAAGLESERTALPYQAVLSAVLTEGNGSPVTGAAAAKLRAAAAAAAAQQQQQQQQQVAEVHRALSDAVLAWLAAQLAGIRALIAAVRHSNSSARGHAHGVASPRGEAPGWCQHAEPLLQGSVGSEMDASRVGAGVGLLLPVASGTVIHFRTALPDGGGMGASSGDGSANAATDGSGGCVGVGTASDFCLLVHAVSSRRHNHNHNHHAEGQTQQQQQQAGGRHHSATLHVVSETRLANLVASGAAGSIGGGAPVAAGANYHGHSAVSKPQQQQQQQSSNSLSVRIGGPVVLPGASYAGASHTAAIAPRPLPPCPSPTTLYPQPPTGNLQQHQQRHAPFQQEFDLDLERDLGVDLAHVSWLGEQLRGSCRRLLPLLDPRVGGAVAAVGLPRPGGVLLTGPPGSGRSQLLAALGDIAERHPRHHAHVVTVRCSQLAGASHSAVTAALSAAAAEALQCAPSLLLLDDLDAVCRSSPEGSDYGTQHPDGAATAVRLADWLAALLDELAAPPAAAAGAGEVPGSESVNASAAAAGPVAVAAAAREAGAVQAALRRVGRLDFEVRVPNPGAAGRAAMLTSAARQRGVVLERGVAEEVAGRAEGFEGADLRLLVDRAVHCAIRRQLAQQGAGSAAAGSGGGAFGETTGLAAAAAAAPMVTADDLNEALRGFVPAPFWGVQQAAAAAGKADGWEDVGGLQHVVAALREALLLPVRYRRLVAGAPLRLRTGALLYGPPGCGKTHVVSAAVAAVAKVANVRFLSVKGPELLNKYIGASEAAVRDLFARASAAAPAVLFFDEFDAIAPPRGHDSTGVTDRVVNQLLTELDGVGGLKGVCVLAATSRPDLIDAALLRPGRLDRLLYCGPPQCAGQRLEILRALSRRLPLAPDVDLSRIAEATEGLTGADLGAILSEAQLLAINETVESMEQQQQQQQVVQQQATVKAKRQAPAGQQPSAVRDLAGASAVANAEPPGVQGTPIEAPSASEPAAPDSRGPVVRMSHLLRAQAAARPSLPAAEAARLAALYDRFRRDREAPAARAAAGEHGAGGKRATLA